MRKLRNIYKMNYYQNGNRSLYESIINYDVITALKQLIKYNDVSNIILIDNIAYSYHAKPYRVNNITILVENKNNIKFKYFPNNTYKNGVKIIINDIYDLNIDKNHYDIIFKTSKISDGFKIISQTSAVSLLIKNFDIDNMYYTEKLTTNNCININYLYENGLININQKKRID